MFFGNLLLSMAFASCVVAMAGYTMAAAGNQSFISLGKRAYVIFALTTAGLAVLFLYQILTHNFQIAYVNNYSSTDLSFFLLLSTFWAGQVGTFLLWLLFTALISVGSGFLFGLFPAFSYSRSDLSRTLKEGGKSTTSGRARLRARSVLVVTQVALALVLLVGSGLMGRTFLALRNVDPGFASSDRLTFRVALPEAEWGEAQTVRLFQRQLQEEDKARKARELQWAKLHHLVEQLR